MRMVKPVPVEHKHKRKIFFYKDLYTCSHVFVKIGTIKKALECPYSGPHKIVKRISDRVFEVEVNGIHKQISIENLKPAFFTDNDNISLNNNTSNVQANITQTTNDKPKIVNNDNTTTQNISAHSTSPCHINVNLRPNLRTYVNKKKVSFKK